MNKLRCVLIIPYFGKIPDYFHLWLKSAEANPDFSFFIYSDLPFPVSENSNVKIKNMPFKQLQDRIKEKCGKHCKINDPYKLCDYKPVYGYLFEDDIRAFDFWGFCDIDLIFGNIGKAISQQVLRTHDKLFMHGHFCLIRNNDKMNSLFKASYPRVVDFAYMSRTNYSCHFDENGTIAYAPDYDPEIRYDSPSAFYDVPSTFYPMMFQGSECCAIWEDGRLIQYWNLGQSSREIMYIHLQKRTMKHIPGYVNDRIVMLRNCFMSESETSPDMLLTSPINKSEENEYLENRKIKRKKDLIHKFKTGALKFRLFRSLCCWQSR